ncbi:hypothetical protein BKA70DRAFT_1055625, partial [Coprinopsis sp. MPI-PUGE-AT-0042]
GRAFLLDGSVIYSPNCTQRIELPPPHRLNNTDVSLFQGNARWELLLQPRRWTWAFGWTCFIPL